jgi:hypothetical protein
MSIEAAPVATQPGRQGPGGADERLDGHVCRFGRHWWDPGPDPVTASDPALARLKS